MRINEITDTFYYNPKKMLDIITQNCGPYLQEIGGLANALFNRPLLRGNGTAFPPNSPFIRVPVRQDRRPRTTSIEDHERADAWFRTHSSYGIPYRSASLFCTGSTSIANAYARLYATGFGNSVIVLPVGEYHYCWSPHVQDMFMDLRDSSNEEGALPDINGFLDNAGYEEDTRLTKAIDSHNEIMLHCQEAILIHPGFLKGGSVRRALGLPLPPSLPFDPRNPA